MKHLHKASGLYFECGELMEFPVNGTRKTYDMTVITLWDESENDPEAPIIVGYYFGDYNEEVTNYYIDRWFHKQVMDESWWKLIGDCRDIVDAYWITNKDVLVDDEYRDQREKVEQALNSLNELMEVIINE